MRTWYGVVVASAVLTGIAIGWQGHAPSFAQQDDLPLPTMVHAAAPAFRYQGAASCSAMACHHGNGPPGSWGSEYTTWIGGDPHARAYRVLFDQQSLLIEKNLKGLESLEQARPHQDALCLNCHVQPDALEAPHADRFSFGDGVGCESCHGPAERWLTTHYTDVWKRKTPEEKQAEGMIHTKNLHARAQVCVTCHVGHESTDVNHDLIAAGHPRLRFEYGTYLASYPARHWKLTGYPNSDHGRYPDFEARAWLVGQVVSARAAVDLLQYRAQTKKQPWPEFSEYGCFGCHHDLQASSWRQKGSKGDLHWGTWYYPLLPLLSDSSVSPPGELRPSLENLARLMAPPRDRWAKAGQNLLPPRGTVSKEAQQVSRLLDEWSLELARRCEPSRQLNVLLTRLVSKEGETYLDWDEAVQRVLGVKATYNALHDMDRGGFDREGALRRSIGRLEEPLWNAFPRGEDVRFDSPLRYNPQELNTNLQRLHQQMKKDRP